MLDRLRARPAVPLGVVAGLPLVVAVFVLLGRPWVPVLDMAMTELRVRDVGHVDFPLVGLPGRIGAFPDQGSHPGPWSFYLVAPFHRLAGSRAWGLELASVALNAACLVAVAVLGRRRLGTTGAVVFATIGAIAVRGYGLNVLTHPWNPYFPVLLWLVGLLAAWCVLAGDARPAPLVAATTVLAAQTHVSYLVGAIALNLVVVAWLVGVVVVERRNVRAGPVGPLGWMLGVIAVLWIPPFVQQLRDGRVDGNIAKLVRHFATDPPEPAIGLRRSTELVTHHFDVVALADGLITRHDAFVHQAGRTGGVSVVGVVVLLLWAAAAVWAWSRRHRELLALHAVVAITLLAGWIAISRIFGKVWFYLTLWLSATVLLAVVALCWTAWSLASERRAAVAVRHDRLLGAVGLVGLAMTLLSIVAVGDLDHPEVEFGRDVRAVLDDTAAALDDGVGAAAGDAGRYVVFWQESGAPGTKGYAILNELERRGYHVGVHPPWHVPATEHRVLTEYDAEIHVVTGGFIDEWRTRGFVEVAAHDARTDQERARFAELAERVDRRLTEIGRSGLIDSVDENIFRTSLEPGLPDDVVADLDEMLHLGEPLSVFIAPAGSTS